MLEKEFKYYLDNQSHLIDQYSEKYIVIKGEKVVGVYDSDEEAYFDSIQKYKAGTFLIQYCEEGESSYTQSYHSRVLFH